MASLQSVVTLSIKKIIRGSFTMERRGGGSKIEQMGDAVGGKDVIKLITLDFYDPEELVEKQWLNLALENPLRTFEINNWDSPPPARFRLHLLRNPESPASYT